MLIALLIFSSAVSAQEADLAGVWNESGKPVLILGESAHKDARAVLFLKRLISLEKENLDFVALEADSSQQAQVDAYLKINKPLPEKLRGAALRDLSLLHLIRVLNLDRKDQGLKPIAVKLLDLPGAGYSSNANWFADRDKFMREMLLTVSEGMTLRGIVFTGSGHAAKLPFTLPRLMRMGLKPFTSIVPFGSYEEIKQNALSVFVQNDFSWTEMGMMAAFGDSRPFLRMWSLMRRSPGELLHVEDEEFQFAEAHTGLTDQVPMRISTHFDYLVRPHNSCAEEVMP